MLCELPTSCVIKLIGHFVVDVADDYFSQVVNVSGSIRLPSFPVEYHPSIPDTTPANLIAVFGSKALCIAKVGQVVGVWPVVSSDSLFYSISYIVLKLVGLFLPPECYVYVARVLVPSCLFKVDVEYFALIAI